MSKKTIWIKVNDTVSTGLAADWTPSVQWKHIDGPLLSLADGGMHWLSLFEHLKLKMGWITITELHNKYSSVKFPFTQYDERNNV